MERPGRHHLSQVIEVRSAVRRHHASPEAGHEEGLIASVVLLQANHKSNIFMEQKPQINPNWGTFCKTHFRSSKVLKNGGKLSQVGGIDGDIKAEGNVESGTGSWARKELWWTLSL